MQPLPGTSALDKKRTEQSRQASQQSQVGLLPSCRIQPQGSLCLYECLKVLITR